jgi:chromosome partitioning protein
MVADDVRKFFGDKVYKTVIPRNVRVSEAPSFGLPAIVYDMRCPGAAAYIHLASEVLKRERSLMQPPPQNSLSYQQQQGAA